MKNLSISKLPIILLFIALFGTVAFGQKKTPKSTTPAAKTKSPIFAVVNDGVALEPIGFVENGKLIAPATGESDAKVIDTFTKTYYSPKTTYNLIFGGKIDGKVTVTKSNEASDCAKTMADITVQAGKAKIKGFVMGLATNSVAKSGSGVRRMPTFSERSEVEAVVRAEFIKQKVSADVAKNLHYHNLTALDVDGDGKAELVGSYWVEPNAKERAILFFIAEKNSAGKYVFTYSNYKLTKESDVMNSEIKALDEGIYHELLLDVFDYNGDGVSEIFTITEGFEANSFTVYRRNSGKWVKDFEGSNYHCAY